MTSTRTGSFMKSEDEVLDKFIRIFSYLKGFWFPQVPIGIKRFKGVPPKYVIDLVRVETPEFKIYPRIQKKYWERAMEGDPIYGHLNFNNKSVWLIEGKVRASYDSIGQILTYKEIFVEDWPKAKVTVIGIVACEFEEGVKNVCTKHGIKIWEIKDC